MTAEEIELQKLEVERSKLRLQERSVRNEEWRTGLLKWGGLATVITVFATVGTFLSSLDSTRDARFEETIRWLTSQDEQVDPSRRLAAAHSLPRYYSLNSALLFWSRPYKREVVNAIAALFKRRGARFLPSEGGEALQGLPASAALPPQQDAESREDTLLYEALASVMVELGKRGESVFSGVDFTRSDFRGLLLERAPLDGAVLRGSYFSDAQLTDASFRSAEMLFCHFENATCNGTDFSDSCLYGAVFDGAAFWNADFEGAGLLGASCEACWGLFTSCFAGARFENLGALQFPIIITPHRRNPSEMLPPASASGIASFRKALAETAPPGLADLDKLMDRPRHHPAPSSGVNPCEYQRK